jgi:hypothetical protein
MSHHLVRRIDLVLGLVPPDAGGALRHRAGHPSSPEFRAPADPSPGKRSNFSGASPFRSPVPSRTRRWSATPADAPGTWTA